MRNIPKAILQYERATKLAPADEDIQFNGSLAGLKAADKIEPVSLLFYKRWWNMLAAFTSGTGWSVSGIILLWLTFFLAGFFILSVTPSLKKVFFYFTLILLGAALFSLGLAKYRNDQQEKKE